MNKNVLLKETTELLKEVMSEYDDTESCVREALEKALENLAELEQENLSDSDSANKTLFIIGKVIDRIPEIRELLEYFDLF